MTQEKFEEKLKELDITKKEFADLTGLHQGSVTNWHDERKPIPSWVESWLENYAKSKKFDIAKELFKDI